MIEHNEIHFYLLYCLLMLLKKFPTVVSGLFSFKLLVVLHVLLKIQSILLHLWLIMYFDFMQDFLISCKDSCNLEPTCFPVTPCASLAPWSNPLAVPALAGRFLPLSLCSVLPHYPWPPPRIHVNLGVLLKCQLSRGVSLHHSWVLVCVTPLL